jgi:hypothetical protein
MLQSRYLSVLEAKTRDEFQTELVRFARQLGFETVSAMTVIDHFLGEPEFITVDNTPAAYLATFQDRNAGKRDPVMQHCKIRSVPIVWDQSTYIKAGEADKWEFQARFGYRYGISLAMHMPKGIHFTAGVVRDQPLPTCSDQISRMTSNSLLCMHRKRRCMCSCRNHHKNRTSRA